MLPLCGRSFNRPRKGEAMLLQSTRARLATQLQRHEGKVLNGRGNHVPYRDSEGFLTIGYGHNLDASPVTGLRPHIGLTEEEATALLMSDIRKAEAALFKAVPWAANLTPPRQAVLVNMAFNLGIGSHERHTGLLGFREMLRFLDLADYHMAAREMLASRWAIQVGQRAEELAQQMEHGAWLS